jgi:hypothetical protein
METTPVGPRDTRWSIDEPTYRVLVWYPTACCDEFRHSRMSDWIMDSELQQLGRRLVGQWTTEATHPELPGTVISGLSQVEWLEGEQFLIFLTDDGWAFVMGRESSAGSFASSDAPFPQRMSYTFEHDDQTISGKGQLSYDDVDWNDALEITYRRTS